MLFTEISLPNFQQDNLKKAIGTVLAVVQRISLDVANASNAVRPHPQVGLHNLITSLFINVYNLMLGLGGESRRPRTLMRNLTFDVNI